MGLGELADLLQTAMGLSAASIGPAAIERAVQERVTLCKLADSHAYLGRVRGSATELQALIEAVIVAESWFFRDSGAFTALARLACEDWLPAHREGLLSLLSLPCAAGEEPYSMAMALIDAGVPAQRFRIDAIDISTRNIAYALRGVYGRNAFRGDDLGFRGRHFEATPDGFRLREAVRQPVRFQQGNLFAADLLPGLEIYDVIFCRNVLIYFDRPTQDRAVGVLKRLLHPKGTLFVAPAETGLALSHQLVSTKEALAFAFRKVDALAPAKAFKAVSSLARQRALVPIAPVLRDGHVPLARAPAPFSRALDPPLPAAPPPDLGEAARLADQGHFAEAAACCEQHLRRYGPSAKAFYLMGLVRDASSNYPEAAVYYRKALYLEPDHYDTQIHLALLLETCGDAAGAQVLRNRARRLEQRRKAADA